jgi:hypothetical protein
MNALSLANMKKFNIYLIKKKRLVKNIEALATLASSAVSMNSHVFFFFSAQLTLKDSNNKTEKQLSHG